MGADGHITIIDKNKAIKTLGTEDFQWFMDNAPTCIYERDFNGIKVITLYHGDNMFSSWMSEGDWYDLNNKDTKRARVLIDKISTCEIDTWEVWT